MDAHLCLGGVYEALQKYDKAAAAFNNVLQIDPDSTKALEALDKLKQFRVA